MIADARGSAAEVVTAPAAGAWMLVGVGRAADMTDATAEIEGIEPSTRCVPVVVGALVAWAAPADPADYAGPDAEARLSDLSWIGPRAQRFDHAARAIFAHGPIVPCRFGTLFRDERSLRAALERNASVFSAFLDTHADADEWTVRVAGDRERFIAALVADRLGPNAPSGGARYLIEQRARRDAAAAAPEHMRRAAGELLASLVGVERFAARTPETGRDDALTPVARAAALVRRGEREAFLASVAAAVEGAAERGLVIEWTGPHPPGSFCPRGEP